jgi:hypothetical protein
VITSCAGNISEIPAVFHFQGKVTKFSSADKVRMRVGSMAGILSNAPLLLPRHPVGITSLAIRFLIRQEAFFLCFTLSIPRPTGIFAV